MLGLSRASQYAGWWNSGSIDQINFSGTSQLTPLIQQDPEFSYLYTTSSEGGAANGGAWDLTGLTGFSGFNNYRSTQVLTFQLPSASWSSATSGTTGFGTTYELQFTPSSVFFYNIALKVNSSNKLEIVCQPGTLLPTLTTTADYTNYLDKWLTVVGSSSETSSSFTAWLGPTSGYDSYMRIALFDTQTGTLLNRADQAFNYTAPSLSSLPTTLPVGGGNNELLVRFAIPSSGYSTRVGGSWFTLGQMFDPLSTTDTSWLSPSPSAIIGGAKAWLNCRYTNTVVDTGYTDQYWLPTDNQDLFFNTASAPYTDKKWLFVNSNTYWSSSSSTTNIIRNN